MPARVVRLPISTGLGPLSHIATRVARHPMSALGLAADKAGNVSPGLGPIHFETLCQETGADERPAAIT